MSYEPIAVSKDWRSRQPLTDADLTDFLALRRVCGRPDSYLGKLGDDYIENERPTLPFIADGLAALLEVGHITIGKPDPASGNLRRIMITASGRARYEELCDKQGLPPYPSSADDHQGA